MEALNSSETTAAWSHMLIDGNLHSVRALDVTHLTETAQEDKLRMTFFEDIGP
jgi:hypothetical protein